MSGEDNEVSSISYYKEALISKMAECLSLSVEMKSDHPKFNDPLELSFNEEYIVIIKDRTSLK